MSTAESPIENHKVVSGAEWIKARTALLAKEKQITRQIDELGRERRALPWVKIDKSYAFDTSEGRRSLTELFDGRSQLVIYHFMFGPEWQEGCPSCSYMADHFDGMPAHLAARDVTLAVVSRAPLTKINAFKQRMGWRFGWVSSLGSDFNSDFGVYLPKKESGPVNYNYTLQEFPSEEAPGVSVFYKNARGEVFHTYSVYGRGIETLNTTYMTLDLVPKGRDEDQLSFPMAWVRHHDRYGTNDFADADRPYWPAGAALEPSSCGCGQGQVRS